MRARARKIPWLLGGLGLIGTMTAVPIVASEYILERPLMRRHENDQDPNNWHILLLKLVPLRTVSRLMGHLGRVEWSPWWRDTLYGTWSRTFQCNMEEAELTDFKAYPTLIDFFTRRLKMEKRPLDESAVLVAPADGLLLHCGRVSANGWLASIKGVQFPIHRFLGSDFNSHNSTHPLYYAIIYLAPGDYHRFHSPSHWQWERTRHFRGELFSVNPVMERRIPCLPVLNERVALLGEWRFGKFSMTAVGATNVGSIKLNQCDLQTNRPGWLEPGTFTEWQTEVKSKPGQELGYFELGSCIVLVFEAPPSFAFTRQPGDRLLMGTALGDLINK